jgi:hypothetical protein
VLGVDPWEGLGCGEVTGHEVQGPVEYLLRTLEVSCAQLFSELVCPRALQCSQLGSGLQHFLADPIMMASGVTMSTEPAEMTNLVQHVTPA